MKFNKLLLPASSLLVLGANAEQKVDNVKPNIIFLLADDMGYFEPVCYGGKVIETPNIDNLAKGGMTFTNAYCGSNISAPSRCALMTGKHTGHTWIRNNRDIGYEDGNVPLRAAEVTVAEVLKSAGYTTGAFGKWGLGAPYSEGSAMNQGFDKFYGYFGQIHAHDYFTYYLRDNEDSVVIAGNLTLPHQEYSATVIHNKALQFIDTNKDKPFFLYYCTTLPHGPYDQPDGDLLNYYTTKTGKPKGTASSIDFSVPKYAAMTARLDQQIGELIAKLNALNILNNTLIFFASDNGTALKPADDSYLNTGGSLHGRKGDCYEGGIKSPLIAYWNGKIAAGSKSNYITSTYDFLPTCAELVNVQNPEGIDGISILPTLLGTPQNQAQHDYLYFERDSYQGIRKGDMKAVILNTQDGKKAVEIYNLANDPNETINLATSLPTLKAEFIQISINARTKSELFPLIKNGYDVDYTGVNTTFDDSSLDYFYPNPTKSVVYLNSTENIKSFELSDLSGKLFMKIQKPTGNTIDLSQLQNGMYFLKLSVDNRFIVKKIVKV
ncbi:MAG: sulfatase-like hydrolase/transferase [Paludibacter sp.]